MNLLQSRAGRRVLFALLYLSEGAPIGYLWWAMPTRLRAAGVAPDDIGVYTSLIALPWALKFLWAPCIDRLRGPRFSLTAWILTAQTAMVLTLVPLLFIDFQRGFTWLIAALMLHAFAAATQDVAIDALAIASTREEERGALNGVMQLGMLVGRGTLGGGALLLAQRFGESAVVAVLMAAVIVPGGALVFLARRREVARPPPTQSILRDLAHILTDRSAVLGLAFAALAGAGFEAVGAMAGPFLTDHGVSQDAIATFFLVGSVSTLAVGALAGGSLADRLGAPRATGTLLVVLNAVVLILALSDRAGFGSPARLALMGMVYLAIGLFTAASYAYFMDLAQGAYAATRFSAFMAATNLCESWATNAAGRLIGQHGYGVAFGGLALAATLALLLLLRPIPPSTD